MRENGYIDSVTYVRMGTFLLEDAAIDDTVIVVEDASDFDDTGGALMVNGNEYEYVAVDYDENTVELATPLAEAALSEDEVVVLPMSYQAQASVITSDEDEPIIAVVSHALFDRLPEGLREGDLEAVAIELVGDTWYVVDVLGQEPVIDGSYIDPETLPPVEIPDLGPDGYAPALSPTPRVSPTVGALLIRWQPVENHDPVVYEVHVSTNPDFEPDETTLFGESAGSSATINKLPDGTPLAYDTPYYIRIIAKDVDAPADPSDPIAGMPVQVNSEDIAVNFVYAGEINVGQLTGGTLDAEIVLSSVIRTGESGSRVEMGADGITVYASNGDPTTVLGSDGNSTFKGEVIADGLTVENGMSLRGVDNEVSQGGVLRLATGATASTNTPVATIDWLTLGLTSSTSMSPYAGSMNGLHYTADDTYVVGGGSYVYEFDPEGALFDSIYAPSDSIRHAVKIGSDYYGINTKSGKFYISRLNETDHFNETYGGDLSAWTGSWGTRAIDTNMGKVTSSNKSYSGLARTLSDTMKGRAVSSKVSIPGGVKTDSEVYMGVFKSTNAAYISVGDDGQLSFVMRLSGVESRTAATYNASSHAYWRVAEQAGKFMWQTSSDGSAWTTQRVATHGLSDSAIDGMTLELSSGHYGPDNLIPGGNGGTFDSTISGFDVGTHLNASRTTTNVYEGAGAMQIVANRNSTSAGTDQAAAYDQEYRPFNVGEQYRISAKVKANRAGVRAAIGALSRNSLASSIRRSYITGEISTTYWEDHGYIWTVSTADNNKTVRAFVGFDEEEYVTGDTLYIDNFRLEKYTPFQATVAYFDDTKYVTPKIDVEYAHVTAGYYPVMGVKGSNLLVAESKGDNTVVIREFVPETLAQTGSDITSGTISGIFGQLAGIAYGSFDFGANRYIVGKTGSSGYYYYSLNTSGVNQTSESFDIPTGGTRGITWDGTKFVTLGTNANLMEHTALTFTGSNNWKAGFTWRDDGSQQTAVSPYASFTMKKRARLTITAPAIPEGDNAPTRIGVYVGYVASDAYHQGNSASGSNSLTLTSIGSLTSGTAAPIVDSWTAGAPASIRSAGDEIVIDGTGDITTKTLHVTDDADFDGVVTFTDDVSMTDDLVISGGLTVGGKSVVPVPVGVMQMFAGSTAPTGWVKCEGQLVSRTGTYADLFAVIGTTFNTGGESGTQFRLPDMRRRFPFGVGTSVPLGTGDTEAETDRDAVHTHGAGTLDTTNTDLNRQTNTTTGGSAARLAPTGTNHKHSITGSTASAGGDFPYLTLYFIIKY